MKRIPNQLIKDYLIVECAWMCITFLAHPMLLTPDQRAVPLPVFKIVHVSFFLLTLVLSEIIVTYIFQNSFTYSAGFWGRLKHFALCAVIGVPIFNIFLNQSNTIMMWDFSRYYYAWIDIDGTFTLKWYMKTINLCAMLSVILIIAMMAITRVRNIEHTLLELASINRMLETEQTKLRSRLPKDNVTDKIVIHGDSHESLTVNPLDVIYVESVGNYLNIVYLNDSELCQKRLRSSLKEVEETLEAYPFLVHTHRAFLVNINFITQVSGNSAGYKISMFSTDRVLPVSKANVPLFREKIIELGKNLE
ncbi:MAG: LytTR family transcriptional regulator [Bacteroides sp.]|nr:LytTR family transcriptional regulator [Bacteroides sp.]